MKKRRQHHVWKAYLRSWSERERIHVLQSGSIRQAHVDDVAVQRDFYKLQHLTPAEIAYIKTVWIQHSTPAAHRLHEDTLRAFSVWAALSAQLSQADVSRNPELARAVDEQVHNAEEDFHSRLEDGVAELFELARRGDIGFFQQDQNAIRILHFMCVQYFRTVGIRERIVRKHAGTLPGVNMRHCWNIVSHIVATNVGFTLFVARRVAPLRLLVNNTSIPFITSDQPIINVFGHQSSEAPTHLAMYYPISPRYALFVDDAEAPCGLDREPLTATTVEELNDAEARAGFRQVFAHEQEILEKYVGADPSENDTPTEVAVERPA